MKVLDRPPWSARSTRQGKNHPPLKKKKQTEKPLQNLHLLQMDPMALETEILLASRTLEQRQASRRFWINYPTWN